METLGSVDSADRKKKEGEKSRNLQGLHLQGFEEGWYDADTTKFITEMRRLEKEGIEVRTFEDEEDVRDSKNGKEKRFFVKRPQQ